MKTDRRQSYLKEDDADPLSVVVNLFDIAMMFAVALMVSMVMSLSIQDSFSGGDFMIVKKKRDDMEILRREGRKITKCKTAQGVTPDASSLRKKGKCLGIMCETGSGETILVPSE